MPDKTRIKRLEKALNLSNDKYYYSAEAIDEYLELLSVKKQYVNVLTIERFCSDKFRETGNKIYSRIFPDPFALLCKRKPTPFETALYWNEHPEEYKQIKRNLNI